MRLISADELEQRLRQAIDVGDADGIERLGHLLDLICPDPTMPTLHAAALWYASIGLPVFPLQPRAKTPLPGSHGCHDATLEVDQIDTWWTTTPDANVGIATGHRVDVVDIDGYAGNVSWGHTMYDDRDIYRGPAVLGVVSTPRDGGRHLYIRADPELGNAAGLLDGVDFRGMGGYVVAPPSVNDTGTTYAWTRPLSGDVLAVMS